MACFLVSAAEAAAVTVAAHVIEKKEETAHESESKTSAAPENVSATRFSRKLKWLSNMLWGGSALLAFEHVWHGEVVPWYPFLTAAGDPADAQEMLHEMATAGVAMAALVTAAWLGMLGVSSWIEKRALNEAEQSAPAEE